MSVTGTVARLARLALMRVGLALVGRFKSPQRQYVHANDSSGLNSRRLVGSEWINGRFNPVPDPDGSGAEVMSGGEGVTGQPLSCVVHV